MDTKGHWENVYTGRPTDQLGWYKPHLQTSLQWIQDMGLTRDASIIDVGGGASTLADDLLAEGYTKLTVLDLSEAALREAAKRMSSAAERVTWLSADVTSAELPEQAYEVWHDRAVFHFLVEPGQQRAYVQRITRSLAPRGCVILATFAPEAPPRCSGLPVQRYSADRLADALGTTFELVRHHKEMHVTPGGVEQMYLYGQFRRAL